MTYTPIVRGARPTVTSNHLTGRDRQLLQDLLNWPSAKPLIDFCKEFDHEAGWRSLGT